MRMKTIGRILAVTAVAALAMSSLVSASGSVGGRPANPDPDNPRTQSIFIYTLKGGETKNDQVYLSNSGDTAETVELYAVDGTVTNTGAFTCKQEVESRDDIGKAITISKNEVVVPANGNLLVDFSLTMSKDADVGEHDGCIVVQKKDDQGQQTGSVRVRTRTAIRVAVTVPGDIHREVSISSFDVGQRIKESETKYHLSRTISPGSVLSTEFGLKNIGNVSADVDTHVYVRDLFGNVVSQNGGQYAVIANTTFGVNYDSDFHPFFGGWYKVKADVAYDKRAGSFGTANNAQLLRTEGPEITVFFWPSVPLLMSIGLLIVVAAGFFVWHKMQSRKAPARARKALKQPEQVMWGPYVVQEGDTVEELARQHDVPVSKVAVLNKLQAPYTLEPGQKIYLPRKK